MSVMEGKEMPLGTMRRVLLCMGLALFLAVLVMPPGPGHARTFKKPEVRLPGGYPPGFHGFGYLDRISAGDIVIEDRLLVLSPAPVFNTPQERNTTAEAFQPGKLVGYLLDSEDRILSLWLIE